MAEKVTKTNLNDFLSRKPYSVIHFDAGWDGYRFTVTKNIDALIPLLNEEVSFGYVDVDEEQDLAKEIRLLDVPSVAYYQGAKLIATVIGVKQNIEDNIARMKRGEQLDSSKRISRF